MNTMIYRDDDCEAILNEDLVFLILSYLPVISLLRFKSVCKSWYSLIQSSSFINLHLTKQNTFPCKYFLVAKPAYPKLTLPLITFSSENYKETPTTKFEFDSPYLRRIIMGGDLQNLVDFLCCDGLVCLQMHDPCFSENNPLITLFLWNPATRDLLDLPQSSIPPIADLYLRVYLGFGFDVNSNDHKLVRIFLDEKQVDIYSLNTNSWRNIDPSFLPDAIISYSRVPYQNSICCWQGRSVSETNDSYDFILTFDVTTEVFGTMDLPVVFDGFRYASHGIMLTILREKIAVIIESRDYSKSSCACFELWVLNHFGDRESWAKLYKLGPFMETRNLGLSHDGNFLFFVNTLLGRFFVFNVVTQETEEIPVQVHQHFEYSFMMQLGAYKESLVSLRRGNAVNSLTSVTCSELATVDTIGPG